MCLRKAHVHKNVIERIHPAGDHHITTTGFQFEGGQMNGTERTCTGGIHNTVSTPQIQAIAYSAGHHIAKQTRKRIFLPGDVRI